VKSITDIKTHFQYLSCNNFHELILKNQKPLQEKIHHKNTRQKTMLQFPKPPADASQKNVARITTDFATSVSEVHLYHHKQLVH
jgi:hypothetical protein